MTEDIKQFINTPNVSFFVKRLGNKGSQPLMEIEVVKGQLNRGNVININNKDFRIENILLYGESVDTIVHGEEGILVLDGFIPIANSKAPAVVKISIIQESVKDKKMVGKLLLDKDIEAFEKVGFKAIKALQPKDYYPVLKSYINYKLKEFKKKNCKGKSEKECRIKAHTYLASLIEKQKKYCKKYKEYESDCLEAVSKVSELVDHIITFE